MIDDGARTLLGEAAQHLRRYRALLLESRSGAASEREQEALAVGRLIEEIEAVVERGPGGSGAGSSGPPLG